jgi:hypothetical protein
MKTSDIIRRDAESCDNTNIKDCLLSIADALDHGMDLEECTQILKDTLKARLQPRSGSEMS